MDTVTWPQRQAAAAASALPGPAVAADATESEATQSDSEERGTFLSVCSNESWRPVQVIKNEIRKMKQTGEAEEEIED